MGDDPRAWMVVSPEYETSGSMSGMEPPEPGCDCVEVKATSRREAIRLGGLEMLHRFRWGWCAQNRADGSPPWKGLMAELLPTEEEMAQWDRDEQDLHP